jgi:hypothetical protein
VCAVITCTCLQTASEAGAAAAALREANAAQAATDIAAAAALEEAHTARAAGEAIAAATAASAAAECEQAAVTSLRLAQELTEARHELATLQQSAAQHSVGKHHCNLSSIC